MMTYRQTAGKEGDIGLGQWPELGAITPSVDPSRWVPTIKT